MGGDGRRGAARRHCGADRHVALLRPASRVACSSGVAARRGPLRCPRAGRSAGGGLGAAGRGAAARGDADGGRVPRARAGVRRRAGHHPARAWPTCRNAAGRRAELGGGAGFRWARDGLAVRRGPGRPSSFRCWRRCPRASRRCGHPPSWRCPGSSGSWSGSWAGGPARAGRPGPRRVVAAVLAARARRCSPCWPAAGWPRGRTTRCASRPELVAPATLLWIGGPAGGGAPAPSRGGRGQCAA